MALTAQIVISMRDDSSNNESVYGFNEQNFNGIDGGIYRRYVAVAVAVLSVKLAVSI